MWRAFSITLKKYVTADECSYDDATNLQIKCPLRFQGGVLPDFYMT